MIKLPIPRILLPSIVGVSVYIILSKLFPQKSSEADEKALKDLKDLIDSKEFKDSKDLRGGDTVRDHFIKRLIKKLTRKELFKNITQDGILKLALMSVFTTAGVQYFYAEIVKLLADDMYNQACLKEVNGPLKIVCDIIKEHELNLHSTSIKDIKELIVTSNLSNEDKINLLKIKLEYILSGESAGKTRFLIMCIIAAFITFVSGVGGLALFLEALYRLFQEGKISRKLYEQILKTVKKRAIKIPD